MNKYLLLAAACFLSACATTPTVPVPKIFTGPAGFNVKDGSTKVTSTEVGEEEVFITRDVEFKRTGTLTEDIRYGHFLVPKLKAGTKMYAAKYGRGSVGWCIPGVQSDDVIDGFMGKTIADCILWNSTAASAYKLNGQAGQSPFLSPKLSGQPNYGEIPSIKEEPVDFERDFKMEVKFRKIKKNVIYIDTEFNDGEDSTRLQTEKLPVSENGSATLNMWGGVFVLTPKGEKTLLIDTQKQPTDIGIDLSRIEDAIQQYLEKRGSAKPRDDAGEEFVKFESTPLGARVTMRDPEDSSYVQTCVTPCGLTLDMQRQLNFEAELDGYVSKSSEDFFYKDIQLERLSHALISATTNGKNYKTGQKTVQISLYTPEEQVKIDAKQAAKKKERLQAQQSHEDMVESFMADEVLNACQANESETDKKAQPLVRVPPVMPKDAVKSGHCNIKMNIDVNGRVTDAVATTCSDKIFKTPALSSVKKWLYTPKLVDGQAAERCGVETKIRFLMIDSKGNLLPEQSHRLAFIYLRKQGNTRDLNAARRFFGGA